MPDEPVELTELEQKRAQLYRTIGEVGDFRRGALHAVRRKCGKPNCACADPGHAGHGPQYNLTRSVAGKTVNVHLKRGPELDKVEREVANYERFRALVGQLTEVNESICEARPMFPLADGAPPPPEAEKGGSTRPSRQSSRRR